MLVVGLVDWRCICVRGGGWRGNRYVDIAGFDYDTTSIT